MPVRQINGWWWCDFRHEGVRYRKKSPVNTKVAAQRHEVGLRNRLLRGEAIDGSEVPSKKHVPTLAEFYPDFMRVYVDGKNKPSEVDKKRMIFERHLIPSNLGLLRLDEITEHEIEVYKSSKLEDDYSEKTVKNHLAVLLRVFTVATRKMRLLDRAPVVEMPKVPEAGFDFLTFEEADRLLAGAAPEPFWQTMILVGLRCGLRIGEITALPWREVDLKIGRLRVVQAFSDGKLGTPKSGKSRYVDLTPEVVDALRSLPTRLRSRYVFAGSDGGALGRHACRAPLLRACTRAGLRRIGWHVLRHTFASHLVMKGAPLKIVQELLGHATLDMTQRYAHLSPQARREVVMLLSDSAAPVGIFGHEPVRSEAK